MNKNQDILTDKAVYNFIIITMLTWGADLVIIPILQIRQIRLKIHSRCGLATFPRASKIIGEPSSKPSFKFQYFADKQPPTPPNYLVKTHTM